jgi:hypothetical protein
MKYTKKISHLFMILSALFVGIVYVNCADNPSNPIEIEEEPVVIIPENAILYNFPENAPQSTLYNVAINGTPYYVYPVPITIIPGHSSELKAGIVSFGLKGSVQVSVTSPVPVNSVRIRPESAGITYTQTNNKVEFVVSNPQMLSVEINGDEQPLFVFANAPETEIPDESDPDVIFFKEGQIHDKGKFGVISGKTVYIAPGAIVHGSVIADSRENIRIIGRGILSGEQFNYQTSRMIELNRSKHALVEGITIVNSQHWTISLTDCEDIDIRDVKVISNVATDDGVDVVGSRNVTIDRCFLRTEDDAVAIKAGVNYFTSFDSQKDVKNITVKNCIIWNAGGGWSNGLEIGYETRADTIKDIIFENIDFIHSDGLTWERGGPLSIHNCDRATISNILYKDIRFEEATNYLIHFEILNSEDYSHDAQQGKISNIRMENITVNTKGTLKSVMRGYSATNNIENIVIKNMTINGTKVTKNEDLKLLSQFVTGITYE